jgi:lipopolysaccharide assembly outer membrane protein LptD (OstA)
MKLLRAIVMLCGALVIELVFSGAVQAQQKPEPDWIYFQPLNPTNGWVEVDFTSGIATGTNGVIARYGDAVLTAEEAQVNTNGEVVADGAVHIQQGEQIWSSEHLRYNFNTHEMEASQFRTGQRPMFAAGRGLHADITNQVYYATNAMMTTDDIAQPITKVRARRIKIIPGRKITAYDAVLYVENVPVFYFPYYTRNLGAHANHFNITPGYRSLYGPFLLGSYTWYLNDQLDGDLRLDYRQKRGVGIGPEFNYHLGPWGEGNLKYYYTHDKDPNASGLGVPISQDRQRLYFTYQSNPATNLNVKSQVRYESDYAVDHDFFERDYGRDPQPNTFVEAEKTWQNWGLDTYVEPRINSFLETIERLPEVKLTGFRQQLGNSPLYYESESSAGYYQRLFAENVPTNTFEAGTNYAAARADTYHQVLLPITLFGWLNVAPRVGGRFTYYSEASGPGATTDEETRGVLNTGAEITFKASRLWPRVQNSFFEVDGLRHIIEPSINYVYVPTPTTQPPQLPQFDYELPSLRLLPIDFPDYNSIDSIDSQNVIRWGLRNKLQTKRDNQVVNLVNWDLYTDWRLKPRPDQTTFADLYSDLGLRPRSWLAFESLLRYNLEGDQFRMSYNTLTFFPNNIWSWSFGHYYLRDDFSNSPTALGAGNNVINSTMTYRVNENWGFRMSHYYDIKAGLLREQSYTVYRDLRSWTAALTFLLRDNPTGPQDYTVAFTFSLKAYPRFSSGSDVGGRSALLGM